MSLASFKPRPVASRTTLITWILLAPALSRITSNSLCSAAAAAPATGAAAIIMPPPAAASMPYLSFMYSARSTASFKVRDAISSPILVTLASNDLVSDMSQTPIRLSCEAPEHPAFDPRGPDRNRQKDWLKVTFQQHSQLKHAITQTHQTLAAMVSPASSLR